MIDREQVLHVARLARLRLTDEEVARMGVEPTSHVVELENVLREDETRPSLPRENALEQAPDVAAGGFRVPSPGQA
jgi:aspartyl-tRNA(Asn)/glutamyl-tRNA(Gln) amidotransferase subunit C